MTLLKLPNISSRKGIQTMKFSQVIGLSIFFKNHAEKKAGRLVPGLFQFFKKALYEINVISLNIF